LLPPIENYKLQQQIITNSQLIDSLKKEVVLRDNYFTSIQNILNEQNVSDFAEIDSSQLNNLLTDKQKDSLINVLVDRDKEYLDQMKQNNNPTDYNVKFIQPLSGVITEKFDPAKGHNGIDIVATEGAPIMSVLDGTVIIATWSSSMGNVIAVQHVNNIVSVYKHCSKLLKKEGDKVGSGDAIALVGNTGEASTGPHLHFELWIDGKAVNPQNYISF
jgi:murein DD-endopeptidase MepM/ murein hydrolase activator NlpD